jgi:hypothetical protein
MREHRPGSDGITSGDEAMGTNGNIFLVQRLRCELEILDDIWGNTEALRQRLQADVSENIRVMELGSYTRIGHIVEARIAPFDIWHGTGSR